MKKAFVAAACVIGLVMGYFVAPLLHLSHSSGHGGHAGWASNARTIEELYAEADVVAHVRVDAILPTRAVVTPLLVGDEETTDAKPAAAAIPFTDSVLTVLEIYKGSVDGTLIASQTGGDLPATAEYYAVSLEFDGDPIFSAGSEHILFLIGPTRIAGQEGVYRIVNPAGRYEVSQEQVSSPADFFGNYTPPQTLSELRGEILNQARD